jgi:PAS domain S-box-containing protein
MGDVVTTGEPVSLTTYVEAMDRHLDVRFYRPISGMCAAIFNDVSEKVRAEEAIKESEQRFRDLFSEMMSGSALHEIVCDEAGKPVDYRFLEVNEAFENLTGLRASDTIGKCVREVIPSIENFWIETYGRVALTGEPTHFSNYNKVLNRFYEIRAYCPAHGMFAVIFNDITEQVEADRILRDSEQRFRLLVELNVAGIFRSTLDGHLLECNDALLELLGYSSFAEIEGTNMVDTYFDPSERDSLVEELKRIGFVRNRIVRLLTATGNVVTCLVNVQLIKNSFILGTVIEVNEPSLVQN